MVRPPNRIKRTMTGEGRLRPSRFGDKLVLQLEIRVDVLEPWPPDRVLSTHYEWRDARIEDILNHSNLQMTVFTP